MLLYANLALAALVTTSCCGLLKASDHDSCPEDEQVDIGGPSLMQAAVSKIGSAIDDEDFDRHESLQEQNEPLGKLVGHGFATESNNLEDVADVKDAIMPNHLPRDSVTTSPTNETNRQSMYQFPESDKKDEQSEAATEKVKATAWVDLVAGLPKRIQMQHDSFNLGNLSKGHSYKIDGEIQHLVISFSSLLQQISVRPQLSSLRSSSFGTTVFILIVSIVFCLAIVLTCGVLAMHSGVDEYQNERLHLPDVPFLSDKEISGGRMPMSKNLSSIHTYGNSPQPHSLSRGVDGYVSPSVRDSLVATPVPEPLPVATPVRESLVPLEDSYTGQQMVQNYTLYLPSLCHVATPDVSEAQKYVVRQDSGKPILEARLLQLPGHSFLLETGTGELRERVQLTTLTGQEIAYCDISLIINGPSSWRLSVNHSDGKILAVLNGTSPQSSTPSFLKPDIKMPTNGALGSNSGVAIPHPSTCFTFSVNNPGIRRLVIEGNVSQRHYMVTAISSDQTSYLAAALHQNNEGDPGIQAHDDFELQMKPQADVGLIICCLLGIDRLTVGNRINSNHVMLPFRIE